jgi:hypothetical protein
MCFLRIPRHRWCTCPDPSLLNAAGIPACPHHIWIFPSSIPQPPTTNHTPQAHLTALLSQIRRPGPEWRHCPLYHDTHTDPTTGDLTPGHELLCPTTRFHQQEEGDPQNGHKHLYAWDGLCALCDRPSAAPGGGIPAPLVPLRDRMVVDPEAEWYAGPGEEGAFKMASGFETAVGGKVVEEGLGRDMVEGRSACDGGEGVFVHVDMVGGKSKVYLLPGFYDLEMVGKKKRWLGRVLGGLVGGKRKLQSEGGGK